MEDITDAVGNLTIGDPHKKNRIQVSNTKKPLFFYVNLAKRYMQQHNEVELSALGMGFIMTGAFAHGAIFFIRDYPEQNEDNVLLDLAC